MINNALVEIPENQSKGQLEKSTIGSPRKAGTALTIEYILLE